MSQLSFDGFIQNSAEEEPIVASPAPASWYKGRVLSHSSISLYRTCPQKWKFKYIDKVPERPRSFFSFGKSVHQGLEFLFSRVQKTCPSLEEVLSNYKEGWLSEGYESSSQEKWFFQEGERILKGFFVKHQAEFDRIFKVEFKFTIDVQGVPVTGFIDRIDVAPKGGFAIVDYKTGKAFDKSRVRTDPQLTLYQLAVRTLLGKPVESVTLYHLNSLTPLTVPPHSSAFEEQLSSVIVETAKGISEGRFDPKPDEKGHCQWCDYQQICPAFSGRKVSSPSLAAESIPPLVDRYAKIKARISELKNEQNQIEETITSYMKDTNASELRGKYSKVQLSQSSSGHEQLEISSLNDETPLHNT